MGGNGNGSFLFLQRGVSEVCVGRHPDNHVVLKDTQRVKLLVSRRHAKLIWDAATTSYAVCCP
jgi:pSer/pThr/pTyr-binding forkhead associated (FHA) protein